MTIKVSGSKQAPSREKLCKAERELNVVLPKNYIDFLNKFNGGIPEVNIFKISDSNESGINEFFTIDKVVREVKVLGDGRYGNEYIPVAYAEGGNYLCISTSAKHAGSVFFMDHEMSGNSAFIKIASSMFDLLEVAKPFDIGSIELKAGQVKKAWINPDLLKRK